MSEIVLDAEDELIFDRNDGQCHNEISPETRQLIDLRRVINEAPMSEFTPEIAAARKRVVNKLLDIASIQNSINALHPESIISNTDVIDSDMFMVGTVENYLLNIDIPPTTISIDLKKSINDAMKNKKPKIIRLMLDQNIDLFDLEPKIMSMCVVSEQNELMLELINKKIYFVVDDSCCLYRLAVNGKLDLIKAILKAYRFPNLPEIISKICIHAIKNNCINILEYFLVPSAFVSAPDQMFCFFINSIEHDGHLDVIKFFIKSGINIKQNNYQAVYQAINFDKSEIIKYFYDIDPKIDSVLTNDQKEKYGLCKIITANQYIGTEKSCNIFYDDILEGDTYFQCSNECHHFKKEAWVQWSKKKPNWFCPCCQSLVKRICYVNSVATYLVD